MADEKLPHSDVPDDNGSSRYRFGKDKDSIKKSLRVKLDFKNRIFDFELEQHGDKTNKPVEPIVNTKTTIVTFFTGLLLLLLFFYLLRTEPCLSDAQAIFYRIILALASGAFAVAFTGVVKFQSRFWVVTGSCAVFFIVFFYNPAKVEGYSCEKKMFKGFFYVNNKVTKGISVTFATLSITRETDQYGMIQFEYRPDDIVFPVNMECMLAPNIDSSITIQDFSKKEHHFYFSGQ